MRGNFDYIIVDLPRHLIAAQKRLLSAAHQIVLVTELSLAGIRDTLRIKTALTALGCPGALTVVASRVSHTHPGQVDPAAFEKGAQIKIDMTIPEDHKSIAQAANGGKALGAIAAQTPITKSIRALVSKLSGITDAPKKEAGGFMNKLLHGAPKKKPEGRGGK